MAKKTLTGTVVSDKGSKTIVVKIDRRQRHPIYSKSYTVSKKFAAHDEDNSAKVGDRVQIEESPPISKTKAWRLINVLNRAHGDISDEPLKDEVTET